MDKRNLLRSRYFLYATEFFAGMSVMAIELGASRLLAPYFSSSQIVWTVIIGTIMIAMALGNIWGGRMADKNPDPGRLFGRLLIAAIWIAAIPFAGKYVIAGISLAVAMVVEKNFLVWASLICCLVIFVFPLMLLGTVTPSLVKYTMEDLDNNGVIVGKLGALNTIGSIIGTFLPTFVTIPAVGTAATFIIFSSVLALLGILYFLTVKKKLVKCVVSVLLIGIFSLSSIHYSFAFWEKDLSYEGESIYNYLQVKEDDSSIILSTNVLAGVQSIKMKNADLTGMYYDYAMAAPYMAGTGNQPGADILILGLGTGTYASMCTQYLPDVNIEGVEIDEKIVKLADTYFDLPESVDVSVTDGRAYLSTDKKYDVIMVDAYQDITIPFQMSTVEFFTMVKEHLNEQGVMVVNMNMHSSKEGSINEYLCDTIASVFPQVYTAVLERGTNIELFASMNPDMLAAFDQGRASISDPDLAAMMDQVSGRLTPVKGGNRILTDDKAPVELLGMKVIDELIADELQYYKEIIKSGDWEAL
ncbi:fused MFS/spermidine synthase [Diplocloster hominis]|uniref:spermidine synthase n=1 Tax=Diplocloster hominis TaxID=3079010 RepID=UPI0031BA9BD4